MRRLPKSYKIVLNSSHSYVKYLAIFSPSGVIQYHDTQSPWYKKERDSLNFNERNSSRKLYSDLVNQTIFQKKTTVSHSKWQSDINQILNPVKGQYRCQGHSGGTTY